MQDIYISIGQNIRRRRKEKHLTQESLAANIETSAQYISRIERGQVCPSLEFLESSAPAAEDFFVCSVTKCRLQTDYSVLQAK